MNRRVFLKALGVAGACAAGGGSAEASTDASDDPVSILVDTTRCMGCRSCEVVCAESHGLPEVDQFDDAMDQPDRRPSETALSVIDRRETSEGEVFVKRQCMHCLQPACASACLTRAMHKTPEGPVAWSPSKCMGCRFCMISCPFDVPRFEYDSAVPRILKCDMCHERIADGGVPACVENCPGDALTFGRRSEMIEEGRRRIYAEPDRYVHAIYGEEEAGGTSWLYLSAVPFEELGLPTHIADRPYPELSSGFLYSVPFILVLGPAFLLALNRATDHAEAGAALGEASHESGAGDGLRVA